MKNKLKQLREKIDLIDKKILSNLNKRANLAKEIAKVKLSSDENLFRPERETQILNNLIKSNQGPMGKEHLISIYKEIISSCLSLETRIKVSCLGPKGSFSNAATTRFLGTNIQTTYVSSIDEIFDNVLLNMSDYGVIPVENSNQGTINQNLDLLIAKPITICGEINIAINHCLLSKSSNIDSIKTIYAHEQSFMQCRNWLKKNLSTCEIINVASNSEAAKKATRSIKSAAIASKVCASEYQLHVLRKNIHDNPNNITRFIIIGNKPVAMSGIDKTSIIVSASNTAGSLHSLLDPLTKNKISMTKIESIPTKVNNWEYMFFIDIEGHISQPKVKKALEAIKRKSSFYKHLGSYPKSI